MIARRGLRNVSGKSVAARLCWIIGLAALLVVAIRPAEGQDEPSGTVVTSEQTQADENSTGPEYNGPAVLSRGNQSALGRTSTLTAIEPVFYLNQTYDTGITPTWSTIGSPAAGVAGVEAGLGVRGTRRWKRVIVDINYEGNFRQYTQQAGLAGTNQYLRMTAVVPLRRHVELSLRQTVASVVQDSGSLSLQPLDLSGPLPANEPFNQRARLLDSQAILAYQKSRRLSFTTSMESVRIQRDSAALVGTDELLVTGDVGYLFSPHATIGIDYNFAHYGYTTFGWTNLNTLNGNFSWRLTRTVDVALQLGMSHGDATGLSIVPLNPDIAAILGVGTGIQVSHQVFDTPSLQGRVSKRWHYASVNAGYQKGISPGNGLILTSDATSIDAGFHYSPSRTWTLSARAGRTSMRTLNSLTPGSYTGYVTDVSLTRSIRPNVQMIASFDVRPFSYLGSANQSRTFYRTTIGIVFTPRAFPVVLR